MNTYLATLEYVSIAVLAVLGNHFYNLPDAQTTTLIVGGLLAALGVAKLNGKTTQPPTAPPVAQPQDTRVGRQETP